MYAGLGHLTSDCVALNCRDVPRLKYISGRFVLLVGSDFKLSLLIAAASNLRRAPVRLPPAGCVREMTRLSRERGVNTSRAP
jgi:hypothetical protein